MVVESDLSHDGEQRATVMPGEKQEGSKSLGSERSSSKRCHSVWILIDDSKAARAFRYKEWHNQRYVSWVEGAV